MKFVQKPPTDETGQVTVRYKGLAEIQIQGEQRSDLRVRVHLHVEIFKKFAQKHP